MESILPGTESLFTVLAWCEIPVRVAAIPKPTQVDVVKDKAMGECLPLPFI